MKIIKTYCDCCGKEINNENIDSHLFVSMKTDLSNEQHYCAKCGNELVNVWIKKMKEINHKVDKDDIKDALETINNAIFEMNNGKTNAEDYYWWIVVLTIFGYDVENGKIIPLNNT